MKRKGNGKEEREREGRGWEEGMVARKGTGKEEKTKRDGEARGMEEEKEKNGNEEGIARRRTGNKNKRKLTRKRKGMEIEKRGYRQAWRKREEDRDAEERKGGGREKEDGKKVT